MQKKLPIFSSTVLIIVAMVATLSLAFQLPASVPVQFTLAGKWDRLNPNLGGPSPEHEVLRCGGNPEPFCVYDKQPEPLLGFTNPPDSTIGYFRGQDVTAGWLCPSGFPAGTCANITFVAAGVMTYHRSDGSLLVVRHQLVVSDVNGQSRLYVYWVDNGFACPWFRSFAEALAANPFPTPFNGQDFPASDCFAP